MYTLDDVLSAFQFKSPLQLNAPGCVSRNDFGKNIPGCGVKTNASIVRNIELDHDVSLMVEAYCYVIRKRKGETVEPTYFQSRIRIFYHQTDSVIDFQDGEIQSVLLLPSSSPISDMPIEEPSTESQLQTLDLSSLGTLQIHPRLDPILDRLRNARVRQHGIRRCSKTNNR